MGQNAKTAVILQARVNSTRLPGKVLAEVAGRPLLALIVERARAAVRVDQLVVATTLRPDDDAVADLAGRLGVECFRGSEEDCLDRYYRAASRCGADTVVRLTGDNPLVDGGFIDWVIEQYADGGEPYDYADSASSGTFPTGLSVEVFSFAALAAAWREDTNPRWREHVTPFIRQHPERFRLLHLTSPHDYSHMRWTVDTPEDLAFVRAVYERLGDPARASWRDVLALHAERPELAELNRHVRQKALGEC